MTDPQPFVAAFTGIVIGIVGLYGLRKVKPEANRTAVAAAEGAADAMNTALTALREQLEDERKHNKSLAEKVERMSERIVSLEARTDMTPVLQWQTRTEETQNAMLLELRAIRTGLTH